MAKILCRFAALCSVWIHAAVAVLHEVRSDPQEWQPENEAGSGPYGSGGIHEPGDDVVDPVEGETTDESDWEPLKPRFTPEQESALTFNTSGKDNLCLHDRFVPEMLLIGAMASGTVSFNLALAYSPSILWPHREDRKRWSPMSKLDRRRWPEDSDDSTIDRVDKIGPNQSAGDGWNYGQGHFFDMMYDEGRDSLGAGYPPCNRERRLVAVDSTSRYALDPAVPSNIAAWYGVTRGSRLKFVYILRDPLLRLHAHYWEANRGRWCKKLPRMGFASFVRRLLGGQDGWYQPKPLTTSTIDSLMQYSDHRCEEILGASLYTSHFTRWFHAFDPSQFTIIPFQYVATSDSERSTPAETLWQQLGVRGLTPPMVHANAGKRPYPELDQEVNHQLVELFWNHFSKNMSAVHVADILADTTANLYGFAGERVAGDVAQWLRNHW